MRKLVYLLSLTLVVVSLMKPAKTSKDDMGKLEMKKGDNFMDAMTQCNETFRIEAEFVKAFNESGSFPDETDRTPKCFIHCVIEKTGILTEGGQYDVDRARLVLTAGADGSGSTDEMKAMERACAIRTEACKCERAYQFMKCLMELEIQNSEKKQ